MAWDVSLISPANNATDVALTPELQWSKTNNSGSSNPIAIDIGTGIASPNWRQQLLSDGNWWNQINPGTLTENDTDQLVSDAKDIKGNSTGISILPYGFNDRVDSGLSPNQADSEIPNAVVSTAAQEYYQGTAHIKFSGLTAGNSYDFYIYGGRDSTYSSTYKVEENSNTGNFITIDAKGTLPPAKVTDLSKITCTADSDGEITLDFYATDIVILNAIYLYPAGGSSAEPASTVTVSKNSDLSSPVETKDIPTDTTYTVNNALGENTIYYWGVSLDGEATYTTIWKFTTLSNNPLKAPTPQSPVTGDKDIPTTNEVLSWTPNDSATSFDVQLSKNASFTGTENTDYWEWNNVSGNSLTIGITLEKDTTYYWRVRSINTQYQSDWSEVNSFKTVYGIPLAPVLTSPADNATGISLTDILQWQDGGGTESYDVYVSLQNTFPEGAVSTDQTDTSFDLTSLSLKNSTGYYWRIVAKNVSGTAESEIRTFVTAAPDVPAPPKLKTPTYSELDVYVKPTFEWDASSGATSYDFELADNNSFNNPISINGVTNLTVTLSTYLDNNKVYYWRVRGVNDNGEGSWSDYSIFTTQASQTTAKPTNLSPANNATDIALQPTFSWDWTKPDSSQAGEYGAFPATETRSIQSIVISFASAPTTFSVTKATLKYNKTFAISYSGDDSMEADMDSFQQNIVQGGAAYTDGCGNNIPFAIDFAQFAVNDQGFDFHTEDDTYSSSWYSWSQMANAYKWGCGIFSHGYKDPIGWGGSIEYDVLKSKSQVYKQLMKRPGFDEGVENSVDQQFFCAPDSNEGYYPDVIKPFSDGYLPYKAFESETTTDGFIGSPNGIDLSAITDTSDLRKLYRSFSSDDSWYETAKSLSVNGKAYWVINGGHGVSAGHISDALQYGAGGTDDVLFASAEEIFDYIDTREKTTVSNDFQAGNGQTTVTINLDTSNVANDLRFYGLTLLINSDANIQSIQINGGITDGYRKNSYKITGTNAMVNVHWNGREYLTRAQIAQRWVDWAKAKGDDNAKSIAQDYIDCVPSGTDRSNLLSQLSLTDSGWDVGNVVQTDGKNYDPENLPMKYDFQLFTASDTNTPVVALSALTDKTVTVSQTLEKNTDYVWKVRAKNEVYSSDWTSLTSFKTIFGTPLEPTITSPSSGATGISTTNPALSWTDTGEVSNYEIDIATDSSFSNLIDTSTSAVSPYSPTNALSYNTTYYWRMRAVNQYGNSNWVQSSFTTAQKPVPDAPNYSSPADNATDIPITGQSFSWNTVSDADNYDFEFRVSNPGGADDDTLIDSASALTTTSYTTSKTLAYSKNYKWHVRANNASGNGAWGDYRIFTTVAEPLPNKVNLLSPTDGATGVSLAPYFQWSSANNADNYKLEIATDKTNFDTSIIKTYDFLTVNHFDLASEGAGFTLSYLTTYYWRVTAKNTSGDGTPSDIFGLTTVDNPLPGVPTPESPANNATNVSEKPTLTWNASAKATGYVVIIDKKATGINDSSPTYTTNDTSFQIPDKLEFSTEYIWKVKATNNSGESAYSSEMDFTVMAEPVPNAVTDIAPTGTGISLNPTFSWDESQYATSYHLTVKKHSDGTVIEDKTSITTLSYTLTNQLDYSTEYDVTVTAVNNAGESNPTTIQITTITDTDVSVPALLTPANNSIKVDLKPAFSWSASTNADNYLLEIATDTGFSSIVISQNLSGTSFTPANDLSYLTTYYWRVTASNSTTGKSAVSVVNTFQTVDVIHPQKPVITKPVNGATDVVVTDFIDWGEDANSDTFQIQIADVGDFSNIIEQADHLSESMYVPENLVENKTYYVRVRGYNSEGGYGVWSDTVTFTTISVPLPDVPTLVSPINYSTGIGDSVTLEWEAAANAQTYDVQVSKDSTFTSVDKEYQSITNTFVPLESLYPNTRYYWRVRASNQYGNSDWSFAYAFNTGECCGIPTPDHPYNYMLGASNKPVFSWKKAVNADSYLIEVSEKADFSNIVFTKSQITGTSVQSDVTLVFSKTYYWRVRGLKNCVDGGTPLEGENSEIWVFTVKDKPKPGLVEIITPEVNEIAPVIVPITFKAENLADKYQIQIDSTSNFLNPLMDFETTSLSENVELDYNMEYYIRIRGINNIGAGAWSIPIPFKTENISNNQIPDEMDLKIKASFDIFNKTLGIFDLINTGYNSTYQLALSAVKGMLKIAHSSGVVYQNPGWDNDDYSNPDVSGANSIWNKTGIALPLDVKGNVLLGQYKITYKITADGTGNTNYSNDFIVNNYYVSPVAKIGVNIDIPHSKMLVYDETDYSVTLNTKQYSPQNDLNTDGRSIRVRYPLGSNMADVVSQSAVTEVSPLWTGNYDILLQSNLTYEVDSGNPNLSLEFKDTVTGLDDTVNVQRDYCSESVLSCLEKLTTNYEDAKNSNLKEAEKLKVTLDDFMVYFNMYETARRIGASTDYACENLQRLMTISGCVSDMNTTDEISTEIQATI